MWACERKGRQKTNSDIFYSEMSTNMWRKRIKKNNQGFFRMKKSEKEKKLEKNIKTMFQQKKTERESERKEEQQAT